MKTGLFSGKEGIIVEAVHLPGWEEPWSLTIEARSFDRSKIFLHLNGSEVRFA